jgi:hypothetical protein
MLLHHAPPFTGYAAFYLVGFVGAFAFLGGAYGLYRGRRWAVLFLIAVIVVQFLILRILFPSLRGDVIVDLDYFLQVPPRFLGNLLLSLGIAVYAGMLSRYGWLR